MSNSTVVLKALGLNSSPNQLEVPPGSLTQASNIIIRRDNVVESRRGFKLYGNSVGTSSDRVAQLFTYKNKLLRHYNSTLQFDSDNAGTFVSFTGIYNEVDPGLRIKSIEANGNDYFTTADGIKKISTFNINNLTPGIITPAGGIKATDITTEVHYTYGSTSGWFLPNSAVSYRVVWGYKDANNNLILGTPSQSSTVYNPTQNLIIQDTLHLLGNLDNLNSPGSIITTSDFVSSLGLPFNATLDQIRTSLIFLSIKLDQAIVYASGTFGAHPLQVVSGAFSGANCTLTFLNVTPGANVSNYYSVGDFINLTNFTTGTGTNFNNNYTISAVDPVLNTITFDSTKDSFGVTIVSPGATSVTVSGASTIESFRFRHITEPPVPQAIPTNDDLVAVQTYMANLQIQLQAQTSEATIASPTSTVLSVTSAVIAAGSCTITLTGTGDVRSYVRAGDYIDISGFSPAVGVLNGLHLVTSVTATTIVFATSATGAVTLSIPIVNKVINYPTPLAVSFIDTLQVTSNATVILHISIPEGITPDYFFQIYRSPQVTALGTTVLSTLIPSDELQLVYEAFPTPAELAAKVVVVEDVTPDSFLGAFLYTDATNGEGINQSNDIPPIAKDINRFKNTIFFANTRTLQNKNVNLLGLSNIHNGDKILISDGTTTNIYTFVSGVNQIVTIVTDTFANTTASGYFTLYNANNTIPYYVWMDKTGSNTDPAPAGKTGIRVSLVGLTTAAQIANKIANTISVFVADFTAAVDPLSTSHVIITNSSEGIANSPVIVGLTNAWAASVTVAGNGQNAATNQILLSSLVSPAQAVTATANSLIQVINRNNSSMVYGYYTSGPTTIPGQMFFQERSLSGGPFYFMTSTIGAGQSFSPDISPTFIGITNTAANPTVVTWPSNGLVDGDQVIILGSNSTPSIDGLWTITRLPSDPTNKFTIPVNVTVAGTTGSITKATLTEGSTNDAKINRIYYSKYQQPEAVPLLNFIDVGASDKAILRIFPLRDSLFIFKEDGLYRLSGETAPWVVSLFDSSCILVAPDSVSVANNYIYGWTRQGISITSESGVSTISRPIDTDILKLASSNYPHFNTATWGVGYESDNSYTVFTVSDTSDVLATIGYRYSNLTQSWTTYDKTNTCGVVNFGDDKLYMGAGDTNFIEQERKSFDRTDYADRELTEQLTTGNYFGSTIRLATVFGISVGDVLCQNQTVSIYDFNALLLKLDNDPGLNNKNYFSLLKAVAGDNMRNKIVALAAKLDADPNIGSAVYTSSISTKSGVILTSNISNPAIITTSAPHNLFTGREVTLSGIVGSVPDINSTYQITVTGASTFTIPVATTSLGVGGTFITSDSNFFDIQANYNKIITLLNADSGAAFGNYQQSIQITSQEAVITDVNKSTNIITLNLVLDYEIGPLIVYKGIETEFTYSSNAFGDPLSFKQINQATVMFADKAFTDAMLSFSTDLLPAYEDVPIPGDGNGIFGAQPFGHNFFGGGSHEVPFRTFVPRDKQRCRFIVVKFSHNTAREKYSIYGMTLTNSGSSSTRAYR